MQEEYLPLELPSQYKPYDFDEVSFKPLTVAQIKQLFTLGQNGVLSKMFDVLNLSIKGAKFQELTMGDMWFALHWIRFSTFQSHKIEVPWECPHCQAENKTPIEKSTLKIRELEEDYILNEMTVELPDRGPTAYRLQLSGDEEYVSSQLKNILKKKGKKIKEGKPLPSGDLWNGVLAQIIEPDGGTFEERYEKICNRDEFSPDDVFFLQGLMDFYHHGIDEVVELTCRECKEESNVRYEMNIRNLFPDPASRNKDDIRNAISTKSRSNDSDGSGVLSSEALQWDDDQSE